MKTRKICKKIWLTLSFFKTEVAWSSLTLILATITVLSGCWGGVSPILEDYNSRFVSGSVTAPEPSAWEKYEIEQKYMPYNSTQRITVLGDGDLQKAYGKPLPEGINIRWYVETPEGIVPKKTVDVTYYYNKDTETLVLPPAAEIGLTLVTWSLSSSSTAGKYYPVIGKGMLDDGTGIKFTTSIATAPSS